MSDMRNAGGISSRCACPGFLVCVGLAVLILVGGVFAEDKATGTLKDAKLSFEGKNDKGFEEYEYALPGGKTGMRLVYVPGGDFKMGSRERWENAPVHQVRLDGYLIGKFAVTNAQYRAFCEATRHDPPPEPIADGGYPSYFVDRKYDDYPVIMVSWEDSRAFCDWAGLKLPTEAQWEYAARGNDGRNYPWGNEDPDSERANCGKWIGEGKYTEPVGSHPKGASPCGAQDMAGNVWQWCEDWYDRAYYARCPERNPVQLDGTSCSTRVFRGGSWVIGLMELRTSIRGGDVPSGRFVAVGFRVARKLP